MSERTQRSVFITGASSGIGRATALRLARQGWRVFAGVRKPSDAESLRQEGGPNLAPIEVDVARAASVARAAAEVAQRVGEDGLDGLVNNAGVATPAPLEYVSGDALRSQFEVNVFGPVAVTQGLLPLLRRARGRIVNIGSVGSHFSLPFGGALCASKSALTSLNDSMRLELRPFGIYVCLVEPGAIHTPAVEKTLGDAEALVQALPPEGRARYAEKLREFVRHAHAREAHGSSPDVVATAVEHALTARKPHVRYRVGADARKLAALPRWVPAPLLDRMRLSMLGLPTRFGCEAS